MSHAETRETAVFTKTTLGFWIYLMTDCVLFATLFAVYAVLRHNTFGGPDAGDLFKPSYVLVETLALLTSSFTMGLAILGLRFERRQLFYASILATFALGALFLGMELHEFAGLVNEGNSWQRSAFLSSFFTLVGTHGLHITVGLFWILIMVQQVYRKGATSAVMRRMTMLSLFWHFLDVIWIFIFSFVYLLGRF